MTENPTNDGIDIDVRARGAQADVALLASKVATLPPRTRSTGQTSVTAGPSNERPLSWLRRASWRACYLAAWSATFSLLVIAAFRVFHHDGEYLLICLNAFTRYIYLPAYLCLAWAVWQRRWVLSVCSLAVVGCHIALMAPDFLRDRRFESPPRAASLAANAAPSPTIRIFFANVMGRNAEHDAMLQEIAEADPDVIVLVEFSWPWHIAFTNSPVMAPYQYGSGHLKSHINTVNVFSRLPLTTEMQNWVSRRAVHTVDIQLGAQTLRLTGLHAPRPIDQPTHDYTGYWEEMVPLLTAEPGPLVVVGDCNATEHSRVYKQLTASRLRSAHDDRGRGYATTWPNGHYLCPPIRIDQAFVSPEVEVERIVEGRGHGSDHKPLIVDLHVRGAPRP
jgi:endonuclease/exonuclease/phosphatase (EEP) superfamily protein YafD